MSYRPASSRSGARRPSSASAASRSQGAAAIAPPSVWTPSVAGSRGLGAAASTSGGAGFADNTAAATPATADQQPQPIVHDEAEIAVLAKRLKRLEAEAAQQQEQLQRDQHRADVELEALRRDGEALQAEANALRAAEATAGSRFLRSRPSSAGASRGGAGGTPGESDALRRARETEGMREQLAELEHKVQLQKLQNQEVERAIELTRDAARKARATMGGVNVVQESLAAVGDQVNVIEARLERSLQMFNQVLGENRRLRDEIDTLRGERDVFDAIYLRLEAELQEKKKEMAFIIEVSNIAYEERDNNTQVLQSLKQFAAEEMTSFNETFKELDSLVEEDRKLREQLRERLFDMEKRDRGFSVVGGGGAASTATSQQGAAAAVGNATPGHPSLSPHPPAAGGATNNTTTMSSAAGRTMAGSLRPASAQSQRRGPIGPLSFARLPQSARGALVLSTATAPGNLTRSGASGMTAPSRHTPFGLGHRSGLASTIGGATEGEPARADTATEHLAKLRSAFAEMAAAVGRDAASDPADDGVESVVERFAKMEQTSFAQYAHVNTLREQIEALERRKSAHQSELQRAALGTETEQSRRQTLKELEGRLRAEEAERERFADATRRAEGILRTVALCAEQVCAALECDDSDIVREHGAGTGITLETIVQYLAAIERTADGLLLAHARHTGGVVDPANGHLSHVPPGAHTASVDVKRLPGTGEDIEGPATAHDPAEDSRPLTREELVRAVQRKLAAQSAAQRRVGMLGVGVSGKGRSSRSPGAGGRAVSGF